MWILILIIIFPISLIGYKYFSLKEKLSREIDILLTKINGVNTKINREINKRKTYIYFKEMKHYYNNDIDKGSERIITKENFKKLESNYTNIDRMYVDLKQNLRLLDNFEEFDSQFSTKKRKYKTCFNKSISIINLLEEKYESVVDKYVINFSSDFNSYKENEINEMNQLVKESRILYKEFGIRKLKKNYNKIVNADIEVSIKIEEPHRLRDKLINAEDNIDQLENELINSQGNLYFKVFNFIKNNNVSKEDMNEWNRIKRSINNFKKSRLLKSDIIELSEKLNQIIQELSDLNQIINIDVSPSIIEQPPVNNHNQ